MLSKLLRGFPPFLKNKYILTLAVFGVWLFIFDKTNVISWLGEKNKIMLMENQRRYYQQEVERITSQLDELNTNSERLEKFAREQYFFKEEGEDIFLIEE